MEPEAYDVCVVGGGVAGLATALAFREKGRSVVVLEKRVEAGDRHRGDLLRPEVVRWLAAWGADPREVGKPLRETVVEFGGKRVFRRAWEGDDGPLVVPRRQLEQFLRDRCRALKIALRLGWQFQSFREGPDGSVIGVTAVSSADGALIEASLVVGADGRGSTIREALGIKVKEQPSAYDLLAWEATLPNTDDDLATGHHILCGPKGGGISVPLGNGRVRVFAAMAAGAADSVSREAPEDLLRTLIGRTPLPLSSRVDPVTIRAYSANQVFHAVNYASRSAVCVGDAVHRFASPSTEGLRGSILDVEALVRLANTSLDGDRKSVQRALKRFELERWPSNDERVGLSKSSVKWLQPVSGLKRAVLRAAPSRSLKGLLPAG